ncbi:type I restriction enzyme M protein [Catenulispora sp. EB89]|uniref:N-6 DNA methylase n=1 Tax=Catenulispora sp. EB89 TaxID=3156257 RepID=UPI003514D4CC
MAKRKAGTAGGWRIRGEELWKSIQDLLPGVDVAAYKAHLLALIFVRQATEAFDARREHLKAEFAHLPKESQRQYILDQHDQYRAHGVHWVDEQARWNWLTEAAVQDDISRRVDEAMVQLENDNDDLQGVLPSGFAKLAEAKSGALAGLITLVDALASDNAPDRKPGTENVLVQAYDYLIPRFADKEHDVKGISPTPPSVAALMTELIEPGSGSVYDPCFGTGTLLASAAVFARRNGGEVAVFGQELRPEAWRVGQLNLSIRGVEIRAGEKAASTFTEDRHKSLTADFVLANPEFNQPDWNGGGLTDDNRWQFGVPNAGNANFAWIQHAISKLGPQGAACVIMPTGSLSNNDGTNAKIREKLVTGGTLECVVTLPGNLFYGGNGAGAGIASCLWIFRNGRNTAGTKNSVLFIDARDIAGTSVTRSRNELGFADRQRITDVYHRWRGGTDGGYQDQPGRCRAASIAEIEEHGWVLTPGRYVEQAEVMVDPEFTRQEIKRLTENLREAFRESDRLQTSVLEQLDRLEPGDPQQP